MTDLKLATEMENYLETMIDKTDLATVLSAFAIVCFQKAEHIRSVWQDKVLANEWERAGHKIDTVQNCAVIRALSH